MAFVGLDCTAHCTEKYTIGALNPRAVLRFADIGADSLGTNLPLDHASHPAALGVDMDFNFAHLWQQVLNLQLLLSRQPVRVGSSAV